MKSYNTMLEDAIVVSDLKAADMFGVIAEMIDALVEDGKLDPEKREAAQQAVIRREMSATTVMTDEIALPHGRTDMVETLICAVGVSKQGFNADAPDGKPTRIVVMLLIPPNSGVGYIQFLANLSRVLMEPRNREIIINAHDRDAVLSAMTVQ